MKLSLKIKIAQESRPQRQVAGSNYERFLEICYIFGDSGPPKSSDSL